VYEIDPRVTKPCNSYPTGHSRNNVSYENGIKINTGKFEFVRNLANLHRFVSDNCIVIHSNIIHTWASWGILLYNIPHSSFPPQNPFFSPSSSIFKPGGF